MRVFSSPFRGVVLAAVLAIGATACGSDEGAAATGDDVSAAGDTGNGSAGTDAAATADVAAGEDATAVDTQVAPSVTFNMTASGWKMAPKNEITMCMVKRLDNETEVYLNRLRTKLSVGSHHMIVYKTDATEEQLTPFKCTPFTETLAGGNVPLMITQVPDDTLQLPKGVAFKLDAHQMIRIEMHFINFTKDTIEPMGEVNFDTMDVSAVKDTADLLFYGNPDFSIPKGQSYSTPWQFLKVLEGSKIFALTGHTHALGKNVEIAVSKDGSTPETPSLVYPGDLPYSWSEPPLEQFDPPLEFHNGEGFQYRCTWLNTTDTTVGFGESATKEMCFFWAYYYPSQGYHMCINTGKYKGMSGGMIGETACCPEDALCSLIKNYLGGK